MSAKIVLSVAYGIDVKPSDDPYVKLADNAVKGLVTAVVPGRFLVASGKAPHSFTLDGLRVAEGSENRVYMEQVVQATAGTVYTAGTGTAVSALGTFILSMLANPATQKKAQAEIDSIVGTDRLPDFDEPSLPYFAAVMKESLRWRNVTPIAIPNFLPVDDEYRGYRAILHDEVMYPDPDSFKPERYLLNGKLNPAVTDPGIIFGFGFANSSVWVTLVAILAAFDITKAVGDDGAVIEPSYEYFAGLVV
ncbi:cytochrome P450 [Mycena epipterygia]|nr:cytochrome P450 [Mycena epipterygia]